MMIETNHVANQISDYVLDLLPNQERKQVERHTAVCNECRQELVQQRRFSQSIRTTLHIASQPDRSRLRQLMPPAPKRGKHWWNRFWPGTKWQKQLAPAGLILILILSGWGMWQGGQQSVWSNPSPPFLAATATMTDVPTATLAETEATMEMAPTLASATVTKQPASPITPAPNPTPVAAVLQTTFSN